MPVKRDEAAQIEQLKAGLTDAGVKLVSQPKGWPHQCPETRVTDLRTADGERIDPDDVKTREGFAAFVGRGFGRVEIEHHLPQPRGP
jgi:ParB family chromosome partitioning protein